MVEVDTVTDSVKQSPEKGKDGHNLVKSYGRVERDVLSDWPFSYEGDHISTDGQQDKCHAERESS